MHAATTDVFCRENSRHMYRERKSEAHKHDALASPPEQGNYVAKNLLCDRNPGRQKSRDISPRARIGRTTSVKKLTETCWSPWTSLPSSPLRWRESAV
jgi:hypothetical protein